VSTQSSLSHPLAIVAFWEVWVCFMVWVRREEKVRDPSNPSKSGRMLWRFLHLIEVWFSQYSWSLCVNLVFKLYGSFFFFMIFGVFLPNFSSMSLEEFFFDSFHGFGCYDEPDHLPPILEWIHGSIPFDFTNFSSFLQNLGFLVHPKSERKSLDLRKTSFGNFFLVLRWPMCLSFIRFGAL
jgi:hypothetical protein